MVINGIEFINCVFSNSILIKGREGTQVGRIEYSNDLTGFNAKDTYDHYTYLIAIIETEKKLYEQEIQEYINEN